MKAQQQAAWATGNYAVVGTTVQIVGELLCEAMDLRSGWRVLDVAAGNGNATLAAARRWCDVTSTDFVPALLDNAKARAKADGYDIHFQEADAENLPFPDASFDAVMSTFGVMFAPDQSRAAAEMLRVCKPGGKIGLANWTPTSFIGHIFKCLAQYYPLPAGMKSPSAWGTEQRLHELFGDAVFVEAHRKEFFFRYRSPEHWLEVFRTYYGPMNIAFHALDEPGQAELTEHLMTIMAQLNRAEDGTLVLPSEYLEVVATRKD